MIVRQVSGSQDFYEIHHDTEYARAAGHPRSVHEYGVHARLLNRLIFGVLGDQGWLHKFSMQMRRMNHPGDEVSFKGSVRREFEEEGLLWKELDLWAENGREGVTTPAYALVSFPR